MTWSVFVYIFNVHLVYILRLSDLDLFKKDTFYIYLLHHVGIQVSKNSVKWSHVTPWSTAIYLVQILFDTK